MNNIEFPSEFIALKYPGYFWNIKDESLYSIKISGILKKLKRPKITRYSPIDEPYYQVYVNGQRRYVVLSRLDKYLVCPSRIPVDV